MNHDIRTETAECDSIGTDVLTCDVSDEGLEAAAGSDKEGRVAYTLLYYSCGSCP